MKFLSWLWTVLLGFVLGGTAAAQAPGDSEFIENLPTLKPDEIIEGGYAWVTPDLQLADHDRFEFEPIVVFLDDESEYKGMSAAEMVALTGTLRSHIVDASEPKYAVFSKPGPGVIRVRVAVTGVKLKKQARAARGVLGVLPIGLAINAAREAVGRGVLLDDATLEAEYLNTNGQRFAVTIYPNTAKEGGENSREALNRALKRYGEPIRSRMDSTRY